MWKIFSVLVICIWIGTGVVFAAPDSFDGIQCGSDIAAALRGRSMPNERVAVLEEKYKNLSLKDLGGSDEEDLFFMSWKICGDQYHLIEKEGVVQDVLKFPHATDALSFFGVCPAGQEPPETILAIVKKEKEGENLPALAAWRIDHEQARFVKLSTNGRACPRKGTSEF